jgi:hypothetical protein
LLPAMAAFLLCQLNNLENTRHGQIPSDGPPRKDTVVKMRPV